MEWSLTWGKYAKTLAISAGSNLPSAAKQPELLPASVFVWTAFASLHTCRQVDGGPIPWVAINDYSSLYKLSLSEMEDLEHLIRALDDKYLELQEKKRKQAQKSRSKAR